jgi:Fe-S cluster assembly protein SufD
MNTLEQQTQWAERQLAVLTFPHSGIDWLDGLREQARARLGQAPAINRKLEAWRYTSANPLLGQAFDPAESATLSAADLAALGLPDLGGFRLVFVNGSLVTELSQLADLPAGVCLGALDQHARSDADKVEPYLGRVRADQPSLFSELNQAASGEGLFLHVAAGTEVEAPIQVIHLNPGAPRPTICQPRQLLVLGEGASATLVEHFVGDPVAMTFHNLLGEIDLAPGARLRHLRLLNEGGNSHHLGSLHLRQAEGSQYQGHHLAFAGGWTRTEYHAGFAGPKASFELGGLCLAGEGTLNDLQLDIRHEVPDCSSQQHVKGIAHGAGKLVCDGSIQVAPQAQHSDAHFKNDNLMLSRDAVIFTKPQLEINADDVRCSHGATVGQIEPEQLFYLRSRGIDAAQAQRMLCQGFAGEIIDGLELELLHDYAEQCLQQALTTAIAATGPEA